MSGSSVSFATSLSRIFFWSKSKIPPKLGRAAFYVRQPFGNEVDVLGFHGAFLKGVIIAGRAVISDQTRAVIPDFTRDPWVLISISMTAQAAGRQ